jgi:hypothetical protein
VPQGVGVGGRPGQGLAELQFSQYLGKVIYARHSLADPFDAEARRRIEEFADYATSKGLF